MSDYIPERADASTPTQVQYPWRAAVRTAIAVLVTLAVVVPIAWGIVGEEVTAVGGQIPARLDAIVAAGIACLTAVSAIITRIMAIPQASGWLTRIGLGPAPAQRG